MKHRTRNGNEIDIADMSDTHLENTIALIKRKAEDGVIIRYGGGSCAEDMWYDEDNLYGEDALRHLGYQHYMNEWMMRSRHRNQKKGNVK